MDNRKRKRSSPPRSFHSFTRCPEENSTQITTQYDKRNIDAIYLKLKTYLTGQTLPDGIANKANLFEIAKYMEDQVIYKDYDKTKNNNLYNFEVLLAILRYLSKTKRPYNERRIKLLFMFLTLSEEDCIATIFKYDSFHTEEKYITITDVRFFATAKDYLKKIATRFNVNTTFFSHNTNSTYESVVRAKHGAKFNVNFMCNTLVMMLIKEILTKYFTQHQLPASRSKSKTLSSISPIIRS